MFQRLFFPYESSKKRKERETTCIVSITDVISFFLYFSLLYSDSESESEFSEENESEDEEFTVEKGQKRSKQRTGNKKAPPPKKEKQPPKATKCKTPATTTGNSDNVEQTQDKLYNTHITMCPF